jgi:general secretion pathway protein L
MSLLVILLEPRPRLAAGPASGLAGLRAPAEFEYVLSRDGTQAHSQGRAAPALLPRADTVVGVVPARDIAWHRLVLPKAPASKLRAALASVLEDALLDEAAGTHLAVGPAVPAGQPGWVAATHAGWLGMQLAALETGRVFVDKLVPQAEPCDPPRGYFAHDPEAGSERGLHLVWARPDGVLVLQPHGSLARTWLPQGAPAGAAWAAEPAAVQAAEQWLGQPVAVQSRGEAALWAAQSAWNLRQFDLALRHRGSRALRDVLRQFASPAWKPARWGLVALAVVHLVGLNAWAWEQRSALQERRQAQVRLLQTTYPQVRAVLDAPLQMQRETERLRQLAGKAGPTDFESLLQAAASAWPAGRPAEAVAFEAGQLTLAANGWSDQQVQGFRNSLEPSGWKVDRDGSRLLVRRAGGAP